MPPDSHWRAATQLVPQPDGTWSAPNLEWLMDSPVELSDYSLHEWKIEDATFRLALHSHASAEQAKAYADKCKAVVLEEEGVFGAFPKYDNGSYTFLLDFLPYVNGDGMEHRDSTVITATRDIHDSAAQLISTVSHEFFHSWNVKRIRPKSLEPFDYEQANMSSELWFAEGFTNYYGPLALRRAGLWSLDRFTRSMGGAVNQVMTAPGRQIHNIIEMSRLAPFVDAATANDPVNYANTFISYYTYGQAVALGIDLEIRQHFPGKSLDDWMKTMWREHPDIDRPYTLADLQQTLGETVGDERFARMIFERHIFGKEPLDYQTLLSYAGLKLEKSHPGRAWAGGRAVSLSGSTLIGSPLYKAGLDTGDQIEECDGKPVKNDEEFNVCLGKHLPGDKLTIAAATRAGKKTVQFDLVEDPSLEIVPIEKANVSLPTEIDAFRSAWLSSRSVHAK